MLDYNFGIHRYFWTFESRSTVDTLVTVLCISLLRAAYHTA